MSSPTIRAVLIRRRFPATLKGIDAFCEEARDEVAPMVSRKDLFATEMLLREALGNAVIHGCRRDPRKTVDCRLRIDGDRLRIDVVDEGDGFDWRGALERSGDPRRKSGRGLRICTLYATDISFNREGNHLAITRKLDRGGDDA